MARRIFNAGIDEQYLRSLGTPPWDEQERPSQPTYVRSRYDDSPLGGLLWAELRRAYKRNRIDVRSASMFELVRAGESYRAIATTFRFGSPRAVQYHVERVEAILLADTKLGLITVIYEELGGWDAVAEYLYG